MVWGVFVTETMPPHSATRKIGGVFVKPTLITMCKNNLTQSKRKDTGNCFQYAPLTDPIIQIQHHPDFSGK